jgi:hypothetical protein
MLTYTDVCGPMLTYADACWRMLAYGDACRFGTAVSLGALSSLEVGYADVC